MLTAFFFCFKDQSALREGHERQRYLDYQDYQVLYLNLFRSSHQRCSTGVRKLKRCSKFLTKFTKETPVRVSYLQFIKKETLGQLLSHEFCEISESNFFTEHLLIFVLFFLLTFLSYLPFISCVASYRQLGTLYSLCLFYNLASQLFFMIAVAIFPVFCFLFLKLNLFSALHLSSVLPFPSAD